MKKPQGDFYYKVTVIIFLITILYTIIKSN